MAGKEQIVEELGELLLPNLLNKALVANDRAKYLMTLLQNARLHADHPETDFTDLQQERTACGIDAPEFDMMVERCCRQAGGTYCIPEAARVQQLLEENMQVMLEPIRKAADLPDSDSGCLTQYEHRLAALKASVPSFEDGQITGEYIDRLTSAQPAEGDSFHLLVMHLHKEINRLQRRIAAESIEGADAYALAGEDRPLIAAFMSGVRRTYRLKFDHPGLDTTATRAEDKLVIQNDIGTTDAHVLVIHVRGTEVVVTYTDVHLQRLIFFQSMLKSFSVQWDDTRSRRSSRLQSSLYHLSVGQYAAVDMREVETYLEYLGSRLVFLIDWNRARKRLRKLVPKRICLEVLQWAATNEFGHMAFLRAGGEQLVFDALQLSSRVPMQIGGRLSDFIGADRAAEFLKFTMKTAAEGLLAGRSALLIRDQVRAELRHYLDTAHQGLLELAGDHAALILELATAARDCLLQPAADKDAQYRTRLAQRAKRWEHLADELVTKARMARGDQIESKATAELLRMADDAADELEEGIFLLTLLGQQPSEGPGPLVGESRDVLQGLSEQLVRTAQEYLKAVENARHLHRGSSREDMADFLEAVDGTMSLEHQVDDAHRRAKASILRFSGDFQQLHLFKDVADNLESASDAMMRAALMLRDYVLGEVITR